MQSGPVERIDRLLRVLTVERRDDNARIERHFQRNALVLHRIGSRGLLQDSIGSLACGLSGHRGKIKISSQRPRFGQSLADQIGHCRGCRHACGFARGGRRLDTRRPIGFRLEDEPEHPADHRQQYHGQHDPQPDLGRGWGHPRCHLRRGRWTIGKVIVRIVDRNHPQAEGVIARRHFAGDAELDGNRLRSGRRIELAFLLTIDGEPFGLGLPGHLNAQPPRAGVASLVVDSEHHRAGARCLGIGQAAGKLDRGRTVGDLETGHNVLLLTADYFTKGELRDITSGNWRPSHVVQPAASPSLVLPRYQLLPSAWRKNSLSPVLESNFNGT